MRNRLRELLDADQPSVGHPFALTVSVYDRCGYFDVMVSR